jgi:GT2 family glycosyltransferase
MEQAQRLAVVAIGRNEGERLRACLASALAQGAHAVVYVDSGSTDGSVAMARAKGCEVVELDLDTPFTAARARNAGLAAARARLADLAYVQFVDGDCEIQPGWLEAARAFLQTHPQVAVVCGRRRERYPQRSVYNRLCDLEWDTPVGEAKACGGDALMRADALTQAGGYRDDLIAGEEPELCVRLRATGWKIWRLDAEMTWHDAAILRFGQWWRRAQRAGHAFAEGASLHGAPPERHWVSETRRALVWGLILPIGLALASVVVHPAWAIGFLIYPVQAWRLARRSVDSAQGPFLVLSKFAEAAGAMQFYARRALGRRGGLIEYK